VRPQAKEIPVPFDCLDVAHQAIAQLRRLVAAIAQHDADLARQIRRAASSVPLNIAEGRQRFGRDRAHSWRVAAGSAAEVREALRVALAWGYIDAAAAAGALERLDRIGAMLWKATH
jgi:four helix bundle protein